MADKKPSPREMGYYLSLAQIGLEMVVPLGVGIFIDMYFRTLPWGVIIGAVLGLVLGLVHMVTLVNRHDQGDTTDKKQDSE